MLTVINTPLFMNSGNHHRQDFKSASMQLKIFGVVKIAQTY